MYKTNGTEEESYQQEISASQYALKCNYHELLRKSKESERKWH